MNDNERTVKIFTLEKEHESVFPLIRKAFEQAGISMHFHSKFDTAYDGIFVNQKGLGDIYVFERDREKASDILRDIMDNHETEE
jgi:hypothetical protein